jgi:glycosyltransferase involved in cell wall biosynthesis
MRIMLFDWVSGGHHPVYLRRFAEALQSEAELIAAAPDELIQRIDDLPIATIGLGSPRPRISRSHRFGLEAERILREEIALFEYAAQKSRPEHIVHLYADAVLPRLVRRRRVRPAVSVLLFYPRAHYPAAFQTPLAFRERLRATAKEVVIAGWRRRPDAHALFTLDEEAARRWQMREGAVAYWVPEPPVFSACEIPIDDNLRSGCILYGALAERKGIDLLARALAVSPASMHVKIAGEPNPAFFPRLRCLVDEMRGTGATVELLAHRHSESEGLRALAGARCALLPYPSHDGMSRVLVEACSMGTPVVVHDRGLLGYLVRQHGLGRAVDCRDSRAFARAILEMTNAIATAEYRDALARFASRFTADRFQRAVGAPFFGANGRARSGLRRQRMSKRQTR